MISFLIWGQGSIFFVALSPAHQSQTRAVLSILLHFLGTLRHLQRQRFLKAELYRWGKKPTSKAFCTPHHIRHVIFSKYQASPSTLGNLPAVIPASPSLWSTTAEFGAEMLQIVVPPHSNTWPLDVLAAPCLTVLAQSLDNKLWNSCIFLHLDEFVERGQSVAHKPLRQCGSGDRKHGTATAAPCAMELPFITQHQPLLCTHRALDREIPSQVSPRLSAHLGALYSFYISNIVLLYRCKPIKTLF